MRLRPRPTAVGVLATAPMVVAVTSLLGPPVALSRATANRVLSQERRSTVGADYPAPDVVPSIREWTGGSGSFELRPPSRIVVDSGDLAGEAQLLRDDVAAVTGLELPVATGKNPHPGDLFLS